jgi:hypothetical protein
MGMNVPLSVTQHTQPLMLPSSLLLLLVLLLLLQAWA